MTCCIALKHGNDIYIAGDSSAECGAWSSPTQDTKVFRCGPAVIAFAGSFAVGQAIKYSFVWPEDRDGTDLPRFIFDSVLPGIRAHCDECEEPWESTDLIIAVSGRMFFVQNLSCLLEPASECVAIGACLMAEAVVSATDGEPTKRLMRALKSIQEYMPTSIRAPFYVMKL